MNQYKSNEIFDSGNINICVGKMIIQKNILSSYCDLNTCGDHCAVEKSAVKGLSMCNYRDREFAVEKIDRN